MIISVHIPKTGGSTFRKLLKRAFGPRLLLDYGDWAGFKTQEAMARRAMRRDEKRRQHDALARDFDIIHGHFEADKYADLFPQTQYVAFFREPYQQALSNYQYLQRHPELDHPAIRLFHDNKMSLEDYLRCEALSNPQTQLLGKVPLDDFAMIGMTEQYSRSIALFNSAFGTRLVREDTANVNPDRTGISYDVSPAQRKLIETYRAPDLDLYARATEKFARQTATHGV